MVNVWIIVVIVLVLYLMASIKTLREYERGGCLGMDSRKGVYEYDEQWTCWPCIS